VNRAVNACLAPAASIDGCHVITVEGLGNTRKGLHPVQARIAEFHGSQCGFCTPGIVMSLYAMLRNNPTPTMHEIEECFDGNLCRCTGYRPILDAAKTFAVDHPSKTHEHSAEQEHGGCGMENCCQTINDPIDPIVREQDAEAAATVAAAHAADPKGPSSDVVNRKLVRSCSCSKGADYEPLPVHDKDIESAESELIFPPALALQPARPLLLAGARVSWLRPVTLRQLLRIKKTMGTEAKLVQGNTEVGIEVRFKNAQYTTQV
jgi:xanthine dehydrogenase/oxidase